MSEPTVSFVEITPAKAVELLSKNIHNRKIATSRVSEYARAMVEGRWREGVGSLSISSQGIVVDGQHRLYAIVESETTQRMVVIENVDPEAQNVMDTGKSRTFAGQLSIAGEKYSGEVAALCAIHMQWEKGVRGPSLTSFTGLSGERPQIPELMAYFAEHADLFREAVRKGANLRRFVPLPGRVASLSYVLFAEINSYDAEEFMNHLTRGIALGEGDPILVLRERLYAESKNTTGSPAPSYLLALTIKAWNAWRAGEQIKLLSFKSGGSGKEPFPEPK